MQRMREWMGVRGGRDFVVAAFKLPFSEILPQGWIQCLSAEQEIPEVIWAGFILPVKQQCICQHSTWSAQAPKSLQYVESKNISEYEQQRAPVCLCVCPCFPLVFFLFALTGQGCYGRRDGILFSEMALTPHFLVIVQEQRWLAWLIAFKPETSTSKQHPS